MGIIKSLVTLGVAMIGVKVIEEAKNKLDKLDDIHKQNERMKQDIEDMKRILEKRN